jgi:hypothetical protein
MTTDIDHIPTPAFRTHLEWEIVRAARREARFGTPPSRPTGRLRVAALVVGCLAIGIASNFASAQVRDGTRRDSLLDAARAELSVIAMRADLARAQLDLAKRHASVGAASPEDLAAAEADFRSLEARMTRQQLNLAEIQASALPPRDDLNAPRVGDRDFVKERIALALNQAQQQLSAAERIQGEVDRRVRVGVATELSHTEAQLEVARTQAGLALLADQLALRQEFLDKGTAPEELVKRLETTQVREDARLAQMALALARTRVQAVERERAAGAAAELDVMRAQVEVKERELELSQLMARMKRLGAKPQE